MLSGVALILVMMFAVLGAYFLAETCAEALLRTGKKRHSVVLLAADTMEEMWSAVLDVRQKLPGSSIVVLSDDLAAWGKKLEPGLDDVTFATPDTIGRILCQNLCVPLPCAAAGQETKG